MAPKIVDRKEKAGLIVAKAAEVFAQKGYNAATIDDIASRAQIGKGTVYEYFDTKQELFFAVFEMYMQRFLEPAASALIDSESSASARLSALVQGMVEAGYQNRDFTPLIFEFWAASATAELRQRFTSACALGYAECRRIFAETISSGIESGEFRADLDPMHLATALTAGLDGLFLQVWFDDRIDPRPVAASFTDAFCRGLRR